MNLKSSSERQKPFSVILLFLLENSLTEGVI